MSAITALQAPGSKSARRSSSRVADSKIGRAVNVVVEQLEGRTLLSGNLPASIHASTDAAYTLSGDPTTGYSLVLSAGTYAFDANVGAAAGDLPNLTLTLTNSAVAAFNSPQTLTGLSLSGTAKLTATSSGGGSAGNVLTVGTGGFSMPLDPTTHLPTATFDLMDNDMLLQGAGSAELPVLQALLLNGLPAGGTGLGSSDAAASPTTNKTALGYGLNGGTVNFSTFDGQPVVAGDVLVKYTLAGDVNFDGSVGNIDYGILRSHLNRPGTTWTTGDFNYDTQTDSADYGLLSNNFGLDLTGPNYARTIQPVGLPVSAVEGQPFTGALATFTDALNTTSNPTSLGEYQASVDWGDGTFVAATVTADTDPADPSGFVVTGTSTSPLSNPDALIDTKVQYSSASGLQGRPASLGEPVVSVTPAVTDLTATAVSTSEIDLAWTVNATNASAIELDTSTDGVNYTATMLDPTATSYKDMGLTEGSHHYYKVRAIQPGGPSAFAGPVDLYAIPMVSNLTADPVSTSEIGLAWDAVTSPGATGIEIWRSSDGVTYSLLTTLPPNATSYSESGLPEATAYAYEVRVMEGSVGSDFSTSFIMTLAAAPTGLTATANGDAVDLAWTAHSSNAAGYNIYVSSNGSSFDFLDSVAAGVSTYHDAGATDGGIDYYEVTAVDSAGESSATNVAGAQPVAPLQLADDAPVGQGRVDYTVVHGQTLTISYAGYGVLINDTDPNGRTLSVASHTSPSHGTLTLNADGTFTYAADANFTGQDTFTYTATDDLGATGNTATVTINVTDLMPEAASQVVDVPQALDASGNYTLNPGPVSGNLIASDPEGDPLTYSVVSGPTSGQGTFTLVSSTGAFTYTPNSSNTSTATVVFKASDNALDTNLATLTFPGFTVNAHEEDDEGETSLDGDELVYEPLPIAGSNQHLSVAQNGTLQVGAPGLLDRALDEDTASPDPDSLSVDTNLIEPPQHGTLSALNATDGSYTYQPSPGFAGRDYFTYRILDGSKSGGYATTFINVVPLAVSISINGLQPGDPGAVIPAPDPTASTPPYATLSLSTPGFLPDGSTVTLSVNSDVGQDLNVYSGPPGSSGNTALIGKDAGTNSVTWTFGNGSNPPLSTVYATGLVGTNYDQVTFTLSVAVAPEHYDNPAAPATQATNQPIVATQPATVPGNGFLIAFDGTTDTAAKNTVIKQFYDAYDPGTTTLLNKDYEPGVGNADDNPNALVRYWNVAFGDGAARAYEWSALFHVASYFAQHPGEPLDVIGYSRGAFEATLLLKDLSTNSARFKEVVKTMYPNKKGLAFPTTARFVGLVAPVSGALGDSFIEKWPTSVPGGVKGMYEGLAGKVFATENPILKQIPVTKPDGPPPDEKTYPLDGHTTIQFDPQVLPDMETDAKLVGVKFK
jgi:VCBS repeat-containing protein